MRLFLFITLLSVTVTSLKSQDAKNSIMHRTHERIQRSFTALELYHQGLRYKNGIGVPIDYKMALQNFKVAADMGDAQSIFAISYLRFKGLGTPQRYDLAVAGFLKGAYENRDNSCYFAGLCFKNGYGVVKQADSAKYWLEKAASMGYKQAIEELRNPKPENNSDSAVALLKKINHFLVSQNPVLNQFTPVQPHIPSASLISGTYYGFVLRYDWSGRFLISSDEVTLNLQNTTSPNKSTGLINGNWSEKGQQEVTLRAHLSNDSVIFNQTAYKIKDHYSWGKAIDYDFRSANLSLSRIGDSVYLFGSVAMFSPERNEPSKPIYLALVRGDAVSSTLRDSIINATNKNISDSAGLVKIQNAKLYPNPFRTDFTVEFILTGSSKVAIQILSMNGSVVYKKPKELLQKGKYRILINPGRISNGMYIVRILGENDDYVDLKAIRE